MTYKIWDYQLEQYAFGEKVFNTKREAIEQLVDFHSIDCYGDLTSIRAELWANNEFAELEIQKVIK